MSKEQGSLVVTWHREAYSQASVMGERVGFSSFKGYRINEKKTKGVSWKKTEKDGLTTRPN